MHAEWQAHIDERLKAYHEVRERIQDMQARLETTEAAAEAADGLVKVTVDRQGRLTNLELDPRVFRKLGSEELAEAIMTASKNASGQVAEQVRAAMRDLVPEGTAETGFDLGKLLPERPDDIDAVRERLGVLPR
ncbi:YbaB/EbfC family nucleoid-associated protein [Actinomadura roseirufa]|uniref:YbaB/EbfC family nucleoid-associated protein n=1 Tax=Actinomadura roseirufa TaxID=2094049 RepID=UPI001041A4FC|nr:YbaB/EbfC family nucleoid-associated protein [Actinomadura roseirufa]